MLVSIDGRIHDLNQVLHETYIHSQEQLGRLGNDLEIWNIQVRILTTVDTLYKNTVWTVKNYSYVLYVYSGYSYMVYITLVSLIRGLKIYSYIRRT